MGSQKGGAPLPHYHRQSYLDFLRRGKNREMVKVLTGMRGAGKTTILHTFLTELEAEGIPARRILLLDLSDPAIQRFFPAENLYRYIRQQCPPGEAAYIFLDEAQELPDFEKLADQLFRIPNYDLYLAGSGLAAALPRLFSALPGRCDVKNVYPLSLQEYSTSLDHPVTADDFLSYISGSTFPGIPSGEPVRTALDTIVSSALFHEIMSDQAIRYSLLMKILTYLSPRAGDRISMADMAKSTGRAGRPLLQKTLYAYLLKLSENGILLPTPLLHLDQKEIPPGKPEFENSYFFFPDPAMMQLWGEGLDLPYRQLLSAAAVEMFRRFHQVWTGTTAAGAIDFVTIRSGIPTVWQCIPNPSALYAKPKWDALRRTDKKFSRRLLTLYPEEFQTEPGLRIYHLIPWLLEEHKEAL